MTYIISLSWVTAALSDDTDTDVSRSENFFFFCKIRRSKPLSIANISSRWRNWPFDHKHCCWLSSSAVPLSWHRLWQPLRDNVLKRTRHQRRVLEWLFSFLSLSWWLVIDERHFTKFFGRTNVPRRSKTSKLPTTVFDTRQSSSPRSVFEDDAARGDEQRLDICVDKGGWKRYIIYRHGSLMTTESSWNRCTRSGRDSRPKHRCILVTIHIQFRTGRRRTGNKK